MLPSSPTAAADANATAKRPMMTPGEKDASLSKRQKVAAFLPQLFAVAIVPPSLTDLSAFVDARQTALDILYWPVAAHRDSSSDRRSCSRVRGTQTSKCTTA